MYGHKLDTNKSELEIFSMTELWDPRTNRFPEEMVRRDKVVCLEIEPGKF